MREMTDEEKAFCEQATRQLGAELDAVLEARKDTHVVFHVRKMIAQLRRVSAAEGLDPMLANDIETMGPVLSGIRPADHVEYDRDEVYLSWMVDNDALTMIFGGEGEVRFCLSPYREGHRIRKVDVNNTAQCRELLELEPIKRLVDRR